MKEVRELIGDPALWGGMNRPGISIAEADIAVCGIPFDGGASFRVGAAQAPREIRNITFSICPTTEDFEAMDLRICDAGDVEGTDRNELFAAVEAKAADFVQSGTFFTFIGGDHSVTIPILRGVDRVIGKELGILHIDAHFDLCDTLNGDRLSHGCTERRALELQNVTGTENLFFVGIRSAETCESEFIRRNPVNTISSRELRAMGTREAVIQIKEQMQQFDAIYLTIDIDALDPAFAPGTGTPQFGGLDARELLDLLRGLMTLPVIGFDLVEVAPPLDPSGITLFAARKILTECWGHYWRKTHQASMETILRR